MSISSIYLLNVPVSEDANGERLVVEEHTDSISGRVRVFYYVASSGTTQAQIDQILADRNTDLTSNLVLTDTAEALYGNDPNYVWQNATNDNIADAARADYRDVPQGSNKRARLANRLLEWISIGRFTDNQIRNKFGLSNPQWTTLKGKMQGLVDAQSVVDTTAGE